MKWINLILSIYLITLSCLPCVDMLENQAVTHSRETVSKSTDQSHEKGSDLCNPFCSCNCCSAKILTTTPSITSVSNPEIVLIKKPLPSYHFILTSIFYGNIWQPPRYNDTRVILG